MAKFLLLFLCFYAYAADEFVIRGPKPGEQLSQSYAFASYASPAYADAYSVDYVVDGISFCVSSQRSLLCDSNIHRLSNGKHIVQAILRNVFSHAIAKSQPVDFEVQNAEDNIVVGVQTLNTIHPLAKKMVIRWAYSEQDLMSPLARVEQCGEGQTVCSIHGSLDGGIIHYLIIYLDSQYTPLSGGSIDQKYVLHR